MFISATSTPNLSLNADAPRRRFAAVLRRAGYLGSLGAMSQSPRCEIAALWVAVATALVLGLAGCAAELGPKANNSPLGTAPYVGVFTGEFVDGKPLYRFPAILVIGSRSSFGPDI